MKSNAPKFLNQNQKKKSWKKNESFNALNRAKAEKKYVQKQASHSVKKSYNK